LSDARRMQHAPRTVSNEMKAARSADARDGCGEKLKAVFLGQVDELLVFNALLSS